jgi:hypothetical protein
MPLEIDFQTSITASSALRKALTRLGYSGISVERFATYASIELDDIDNALSGESPRLALSILIRAMALINLAEGRT